MIALLWSYRAVKEGLIVCFKMAFYWEGRYFLSSGCYGVFRKDARVLLRGFGGSFRGDEDRKESQGMALERSPMGMPPSGSFLGLFWWDYTRDVIFPSERRTPPAGSIHSFHSLSFNYGLSCKIAFKCRVYLMNP